MLQTVQLSIADGKYAAAVREAAARSCAWRVELVERPDLAFQGVLVLDEASFERLPLPLSNPERIVLVTRQAPQLLAEAWDAGIVSVVSDADPIGTVLLAIMAAALRVAQSHSAQASSGLSPSTDSRCASIAPHPRHASYKHWKTH